MASFNPFSINLLINSRANEVTGQPNRATPPPISPTHPATHPAAPRLLVCRSPSNGGPGHACMHACTHAHMTRTKTVPKKPKRTRRARKTLVVCSRQMRSTQMQCGFVEPASSSAYNYKCALCKRDALGLRRSGVSVKESAQCEMGGRWSGNVIFFVSGLCVCVCVKLLRFSEFGACACARARVEYDVADQCHVCVCVWKYCPSTNVVDAATLPSNECVELAVNLRRCFACKISDALNATI